jgi:hypothetical protein
VPAGLGAGYGSARGDGGCSLSRIARSVLMRGDSGKGIGGNGGENAIHSITPAVQRLVEQRRASELRSHSQRGNQTLEGIGSLSDRCALRYFHWRAPDRDVAPTESSKLPPHGLIGRTAIWRSIPFLSCVSKNSREGPPSARPCTVCDPGWITATSGQPRSTQLRTPEAALDLRSASTARMRRTFSRRLFATETITSI